MIEKIKILHEKVGFLLFLNMDEIFQKDFHGHLHNGHHFTELCFCG